METLKVYEYNHETGVENVREVTDAEQAEIEQNAAQFNADFLAAEAEAEAKATAKAALLARLNMTEEEAKLLLS
jgi:hypothetical protein